MSHGSNTDVSLLKSKSLQVVSSGMHDLGALDMSERCGTLLKQRLPHHPQREVPCFAHARKVVFNRGFGRLHLGVYFHL